jgi:hypothetical protein
MVVIMIIAMTIAVFVPVIVVMIMAMSATFTHPALWSAPGIVEIDPLGGSGGQTGARTGSGCVGRACEREDGQGERGAENADRGHAATFLG